MSQNCQYRVSAKALIRGAEDTMLFIEENGGGGFELPGGGIENGETARQALERELKEELNANLISMNNAPRFVWIINGELVWLIYEVIIDGINNFKPSEHAANARFCKPSDLHGLTEHGLGYCTNMNYQDLLTFTAS